MQVLSQHHCVSEQVVLGSLPWCWVILLLRDSRASTNTTGHFPLMWHKRKRLKMSVLTLAACRNQYAELSCVYNAKVKGKSRKSRFPHPTSPLPHADTLQHWRAGLESGKNSHKVISIIFNEHTSSFRMIMVEYQTLHCPAAGDNLTLAVCRTARTNTQQHALWVFLLACLSVKTPFVTFCTFEGFFL